MNITYFDFNSLVKINTTLEYYDWLRSELKIKKVVGKNFIRIGKANDGGYVMVDNFQNNSVGGASHILSEFQMTFRGIGIWRNTATKFSCTI